MIREFKGIMSKAVLYSDRLSILQKGSSGFGTTEKTIFFTNLIGIQIQKPDLINSGYMHFIISGASNKVHKSFQDLHNDENIILFSKDKYDEALLFKKIVEKTISTHTSTGDRSTVLPSQATLSSADELMKWKSLLDNGTITDDEFNIQKNKILRNASNTTTYTNITHDNDFRPNTSQNKKHNKNYNNKKIYVIAAIVIVFCLIMLSIMISTDGTIENDKKDTLSMIEINNWYEDKLPTVSKDLIEYANGIDGLNNINITDSKFRFGENSDTYECHYAFYFTCTVNDINCSGEARSFMKYNDTEINWFHFEIFTDQDWVTITEHYEDSYDQIINDYYMELLGKYE